MENRFFKKAVPIWAVGCAKEMNCALVFSAVLPSLDGCTLTLAAYTVYRLYVNDTFVAFGPARAAKGYARVDRIDLTPYHSTDNEIRVEVIGYHCRSLATALAPSFFCAEVTDRTNAVLLSTGGERDFLCCRFAQKVRHAERYSMQRHFGEVWDFQRPFEDRLPTEPAPTPQFLDRVAPYPAYRDIRLQMTDGRGTFAFDADKPYRENRYSFPSSAYWGEYPRDNIENRPYVWFDRMALHATDGTSPLPVTILEGEYAVFNFGMIHAGFLTFSGTARTACEIVVAYSEYSEDGTFSFTQMNTQNVISCTYHAHAAIDFQSFEPYTVRNVIVTVKSGAVTLDSVGVKTFENAMDGAYRPALGDNKLQSIYDAALRTFAHNAVDAYTDCPSRERAGWLCDSYFTGVVEHFLFGRVPVEDAFLENYRLFRSDPFIPTGLLPMCYPADTGAQTGYQKDRPYIPQWCMWYVLEVRDYLTVRNPAKDKELFRASVMGIVDFLTEYENSDGLLETLPGWNFVEWSDANDWVRDVNYPTNFLYAEVLRATAQLYGDPAHAEKAKHVAKVATAQSFDGALFVDHAKRDDAGKLRPLSDTSEAGQYYALLFGGIDLDGARYATLKHRVLTGFADMKTQTERNYVPVNAFIGLYLRIMTLLKIGAYQILLDELEGFFGEMVAKTNTLWEYRQLMRGSLDHGFASYAAYAMATAQKALGILK